MPQIHPVTVKLVNGKHQCIPSPTEVTGGDGVSWATDSLPIFFPNSPFEEGSKVLAPGTTSMVKKGLPKNSKFSGKVKVGRRNLPVEGDIIVVDPG